MFKSACVIVFYRVVPMVGPNGSSNPTAGGVFGSGTANKHCFLRSYAMLRVHPLHLLDMHTWPESVVSLIRTFLEESDMVRLNAASLVQQESRLSRPGTRYSRTTGLQTPNFKPKQKPC